VIIALPETGHNHLADALVRDLGFTRTHVDAPLRELLLALDPFVDSGVTLANMGPSPRLSSKLEQVGGGTDEERWDRLLNPPRPGAAPDRNAKEVRRLLDVLREQMRTFEPPGIHEDTVIVGVDTGEQRGNIGDPHTVVAIAGRGLPEGTYDTDDDVHILTPAGIVGEQEAIVAYVKQLRQPVRVPTLVHVEPDLPPVGPKEEWSFNPQTGESFINGEPLPKDDVVLVMPGVDAVPETAENPPA